MNCVQRSYNNISDEAARRLHAILLAALAVSLVVLAAQTLHRRAAPQIAAAPVAVPVELAAADDAQVVAVRTRRPYCYTILVSGVDDAGGGCDTNLLVRLDVPNGRIDAVSLPRDTLLHTQRHSNKLNFAYASGGTERLRADVERLLGVPVDSAVTVDLKGFVTLIDRIGGVDFDVPADMDYDDPAQNLHIHYEKGAQHLSGQQAMEVVRWRKNNAGGGYADADLGRIETQQAFLKAAARQALRLRNVPALARTLAACVKTDLTAANLAWLAGEAAKIGTEGLRFHTLPGDGAGWYRGESVFVLDPDATLALVNEALNPYDRPIAAEELDILVP